jgi:TonB-dependent SusC/RagA subfamily outer membrane receptor
VDALYFGKKEKVVTWNTAFIVLEKLDDYIKYNITPPKELEPLCDMNLFVTADEERKRYYGQLGHLEMLTALAQNYNQRISAWDNTQPLIEIKPETVQLRTNQATQGDQAKKATGSNEIPIPNNSPVLTGTEVVVTALGQTRQPKELGYSVSRVRAGELTQAKPVNLQNGLTGKVSGLNINTVNNSVFADTRITLRGIRSLTGNNQPMLILDGQPVRLELLSSINPNNILNVTILKSAAATAIYGSEAVNGVLVIQSKMGSRSGYWFSRGAYKLKNQPDVDYLEEIKQSGRRQALSCYRELRKTEGDGAGFYMDIAQYLYKKGFRKEAKVILYSAAETVRNDRQVAKAIGYILEAWKEFEEAINVYQFLLESDPNDIKAYRDLALAQYQAGKYQESVNMYYKGIMRNEAKSLHPAYGPSTKALMLQEMNAIILLHGDSLDISGIQKELIRPLYNDLRIVLDCNTNAAYNEISVVEPGGKICSYYSMKNTSGRVWGHNYYYSNNELQEYQVKEAAAGKYRIRVSYSEYIQAGVKIPTMIKITTFKNFGRSNQEILVENVIMDNQGGDVEIGEVSWNKQRTRS